MKRDKRKKNKKKAKKSILRFKKEASFEPKTIHEFNNGESYYLYNLALEAVKNRKTVIAEINGSENSILDIFYKGLKDNEGSEIVFYSIDRAFTDEFKKKKFFEGLKEKGITESQIKLTPLSDGDAVIQINDKTLDIVFIHDNNGSLYNNLCKWFRKIKDDGWFSGYISLPQQNELERFAIEMGLGYSITSMPLTKDIFEIYSKEISEGLRKLKDFLDLGRFVDAKNIASRIMTHYPHSPFITNLKAELDYQCGLVNDAKALFKKIIEAWPYHVRTMNNLAAIEANAGNIINARRLLEKILTIDPNNFDAMTNLKEIERLSPYKI